MTWSDEIAMTCLVCLLLLSLVSHFYGHSYPPLILFDGPGLLLTAAYVAIDLVFNFGPWGHIDFELTTYGSVAVYALLAILVFVRATRSTFPDQPHGPE